MRQVPSIFRRSFWNAAVWEPRTEEVDSMRRDVRNILCSIGAYNGIRSHSTYYPLKMDDVRYQCASVNGLWYPVKKPAILFIRMSILARSVIMRKCTGNLSCRHGWCDPLSGIQSSGCGRRPCDHLRKYRKRKRRAENKDRPVLDPGAATAFWNREEQSFTVHLQAAG